ncbi:MAG: hypothetical protein NT030_08315 [Candidatus Saganbacteria bacterium]|nr:hypothetical protein [Candidatus Saganbacteria bacterium]
MEIDLISIRYKVNSVTYKIGLRAVDRPFTLKLFNAAGKIIEPLGRAFIPDYKAGKMREFISYIHIMRTNPDEIAADPVSCWSNVKAFWKLHFTLFGPASKKEMERAAAERRELFSDLDFGVPGIEPADFMENYVIPEINRRMEKELEERRSKLH